MDAEGGDGQATALTGVVHVDGGGQHGARPARGRGAPLEQAAEDGVADRPPARAGVVLVVLVVGHGDKI